MTNERQLVRVHHVNAVIEAASRHGSQLFYDHASTRVARLSLDEYGDLWLALPHGDGDQDVMISWQQAILDNLPFDSTVKTFLLGLRAYVLINKPLPSYWLTGDGNSHYACMPGYTARDGVNILKETSHLPVFCRGKDALPMRKVAR